MRLLIVTRENANDRMFGLGKSIGKIALGLIELGHEVHYLSKVETEHIDLPKSPWYAPLFTDSVWQHPALDERLTQSRKAGVMANQLQPTHVWFQDPWLVKGFFETFNLGKTHRLKWGVSEHGLGSFAWATTQDGLCVSPSQYATLMAYEKKIVCKADWLICPSHAALNALQRDLQVLEVPSHWHALHYGCPEGLSAPLNEQKSVVTIGVLGRIAPVKKLDVIFEALASIEKRTQQPVRLLIGGSGDIDWIDQLTKQFKIKSAIEWHEFSDVALFFEQIDCYVSACNIESFGLANREAVAAGIPSVIACGGAACEVLNAGAWLVPPSVSAISEALLALIEQPQLRTFWLNQAHLNASKWDDWPTVVKKYEHVLQYS